ncbi:unnamed protein product, partial [Scytosiphon promiscuus]
MGETESNGAKLVERLPPRLSSVLRRANAGDGPGFDLDSEILQRARVESQWKSQADAKASAPFTWKAFSDKVPASEAQRAAGEQDKFRRYCRLAGQLAGGDDGAAFPNADRALFQAINAGPDAAGQARRDLELVVGKVPNKDWEDAAALAQELHAWRRARVRGPQRRSSSSVPSPSAAATAAAGAEGQLGRGPGRPFLSYGGDIVFNFDLDGLGAEEEEGDELDKAFPGAGGDGPDAYGGFAFDSFDSLVGNGGIGGRGSGALGQQQRWLGRPETGVPAQEPSSTSSLEEKDEEKKQRHEDRHDHAGASAAAASAAGFPAAAASFSGKPGAAAQPPADVVDAGWLYSRCMQFHAQQGARGLPPADLASSILETLSRSSDPGELQGSLFDLLGEAGLELMMELIDKAPALAQIDARDLFAIADAHGGAGVGGGGFDGSGLAAGMSEMGFGEETPGGRRTRQGFAFESEEGSIRGVELRKEGRAVSREELFNDGAGRFSPHSLPSSVGFEDEYLKQERLLGLQGGGTGAGGDSEEARMLAELAPEGTREWHERRSGMPAGATKTVVPGQYEQVHIPPPKLKRDQDQQLVPITDLEPWAQLAFKGTKRLNPMQSKVYHAAFKTSENLLVCAPTGAGKTNVAMLSLLQLVRQHIRGGALERGGIKAIYVAPMKALAQEVVSKFSQRLKPLGLVVREYTGDMQLSKQEVEGSQVIVTTPEKWDVVTRKGGDGSLVSSVGLIMIDEVHLLADERGAVIESIVARTQRYMETTQTLIRLVGLSATLPNYQDVAAFLRVNPSKGLFYFGPEHRPVPLEQTFIGVTDKQRVRQQAMMNRVAYERTRESLQRGHQVMVFVHARKDTVRTGQAILELAQRDNALEEFTCAGSEHWGRHAQQVAKSRNKELRDLFEAGVGCHHAGMLRSDRGLTERSFEDGAIKVLVCTATLAWGVNLPAHTVIIKGTEVYNPEKGGLQDISMLDVLQVFGRAGRPQYDTSGEAIMITTHKSLDKYLALLAKQTPIESGFIKALPDHLNAEVSSGTVTTVEEGVTWLSYTYLHVRMRRNPMAYGVPLSDREADPMLLERRRQLITQAADTLDDHKMLRFDRRSGNLAVTDLGRAASHFYISHESVFRFNGAMMPTLPDAAAVNLVCLASEFDQVKVRPEELKDMDGMRKRCPLEVRAPLEESAGKVNVLLQSYIGGERPKSFTLASDTNYVAQNAGRVSRAVFEIALRKGWCGLALTMLEISKAIDRRVWWFQSPLRQFGVLPGTVLMNLEGKGGGGSGGIVKLLDMDAREVGALCHNHRMGDTVLRLARSLPALHIETSVQPVTRGILRLTLTVSADFIWQDKFHGGTEAFYIWVEDGDNEHVYHSENFLLKKKRMKESQELSFNIPVFEPLPAQYWVRWCSDRWVGCDDVQPVSFQHLVLPERYAAHTTLLDLRPLPTTALQNPKFESLYRYEHFNPIQTQLFHVLYHSDESVLLGAPTGSGKTAVAEIAIMRMLNEHPGAKAVYVAPLKALARERLKDWREKFGKKMGMGVLELTGDHTPDGDALRRATIIVTTPEKWDGVTRGWKNRDYVKDTGLVIMDEIHLLGEDRGPVLEVIVSRMRYIAASAGKQENGTGQRQVRFVGLSTALANPRDLSDWLGVKDSGLYNFRPSVRPIPCEVHIQGYPGKHYCPRMASMNKPTYAAIMEHSPDKPVLVFVASRRQTRLTALDLISLCARADNPRRFVRMPEEEASNASESVRDQALQHTLAFGIGIHHAGLAEGDRSVVEALFEQGKIQVLVCTSTLAWGVNFPAHLVVVKGTEFFDGKSQRYVDFPITDLLQMIGRAGRPQFDDHAVACILVHEPKKNFFKKFLYEPFPVESKLPAALHNHLSAECAGGAIRSRRDAVDYLTWTFYFVRLMANPSFYGLEDSSTEGVKAHLLNLVESTLADLEDAGCIELGSGDGDGGGAMGGGRGTAGDEEVRATPLAMVASRYYLDYRTMKLFQGCFGGEGGESATLEHLCRMLSDAQEFAELPVRHNEDVLNGELSKKLPWTVGSEELDSPHVKAHLLLQAHFDRCPLPISDYVTDTRSVLDQAVRVMNAMLDIAAGFGLLETTLGLLHLHQMVVQAAWEDADTLLQLPGVGPQQAARLRRSNPRSGKGGVATLRDLALLGETSARRLLESSGLAAVD